MDKKGQLKRSIKGVFHYADFRDWNRGWIFQNRAVLVLKNSDWNRHKISHITINEHGYFYVTGSSTKSAEPKPIFFRGVGGAYEYLYVA